MIVGIFDQEGGRTIHNDDLDILQTELMKIVELQYAGSGAFIMQNCLVGGSAGAYTISAGLVYINGKMLEFDAVSGIASFPQYIVQNADVPMDSFPLEQGGSAPKRKLQKAGLVSSAPVSGEFIVMGTGGGRSYADVMAPFFVRTSGSQVVNGQKTFTSAVISSGIDLPGGITTINAPSWVTTPRLADGSVTNPKLADGAVSTTKIANDAVTTAKIPVFNIVTDHLATSSVTNAKLANDSVDANKLQNNSVYTAKIVDGNVTAVKIADGNVTESKLATAAVTTTKIADGNVTAAKLASDALDLVKGNGYSSDNSVDFTTIGTYASRTYGSKLWNLTRNTGTVRPYVEFQCQLARDSGGSESVQLQLQRSPNNSTWTTIKTATYKLDDASWTNGIITTVDNAAVPGSNYYRMVATVIVGSLCYMSNNYTANIFGVNIF